MQYAAINGGTVTELFDEFVEDGPRSVPLAERFHPEFVAALIPVPAGHTVAPGDSYDGVRFGPPSEPKAPVLTAEQVLAQRDALLAQAALRIAPLQDAVDLGDATAAEEAALKAWRQYRVKLMRIELQSGFPASVVWPDAPT